MEKLKNKKGITLIALVITIIVLLILAGVVINLTLGENGILNKASEAGEAYRKAAAKEKVELILADFAANRAIGDTKTLEEYLNEQKEQGKLEEVTNNGDGTITVEVDGYEITIREEDLKIIEIGGAKGGIKPEGEAVVITEGKVAYGGKVEIKVTARIGEGTILSITPTNGATEKDNTPVSGASVEKIYEVKKNGTYNFTIEGSNGKTKTVSVKVSNIDMPEVTASITEIKAKKFTISVSTTYPEGTVKEYKYYVNGNVVKEGTLDTSYIVENLQPETKYGVYVEACEENGESIKSELQEITTPKLPQAGVSEPSNSSVIRQGNKLPFTWPQLNEIAKMIANNDSITNDTAEFTLVYEGEEYLIGVGDWTTVNEKKVRIMGFNHDELVDKTIYNNTDGKENTYAGITFEFVEFIMESQINSTITNSGGWEACPLRVTLNSTTCDSLENQEYIKEVKKQYIKKYNDANSVTISNDKLWLLSCSEIWNYGNKPGWYRGAITKEGERYKYYAIFFKDTTPRGTDITKKPNTTNSSYWWLRSPEGSSSNSFNYVSDSGDNGTWWSKDVHGIAPGFAI